MYNHIGLKPIAWLYAPVIWNLAKWNSVKWNKTRRIGAIFACFHVVRVCQRQLRFLVFKCYVLYKSTFYLLTYLPTYLLTWTCYHEDQTCINYLWCTSDHVFDKITMSWCINDRDVVLRCFKLPQRNINCDTTFTLSFQLVQNPCILEGAFAHLQ